MKSLALEIPQDIVISLKLPRESIRQELLKDLAVTLYSITAYNLRYPREKLSNSNNVLFGCGSSPRWEPGYYRSVGFITTVLFPNIGSPGCLE